MKSRMNIEKTKMKSELRFFQEKDFLKSTVELKELQKGRTKIRAAGWDIHIQRVKGRGNKNQIHPLVSKHTIWTLDSIY